MFDVLIVYTPFVIRKNNVMSNFKNYLAMLLLAHIRLYRIEWGKNVREVNQSACMWKEAEGRRCTYKFNIKVRWRNHCCRVKAKSITYSECVFVAIVCQAYKAHAPCYILIYVLFGSTIFFHIFS